MQKLSYKLSRGMTDILVAQDGLEELGGLPADSLFVYPASLPESLKKRIPTGSHRVHVFRDGEGGKTLESAMELVDVFVREGFRRNSTVVSIGGGSTSDTVGLAASLYMRGINFVSVPTTLLAMIDASLGGKNAVNYNGVKNLIGSFYSPSRIIIDTGIVKTMPQSLVTDGLGEVAKYALIMDPELYRILESEKLHEIMADPSRLEELVSVCVKNKMSLVERDEFDLLDRRVVLNFGHTLGHAIESASGFSIGHGIAVAHGIMIETELGIEAGLIGEEMREASSRLLKLLGLPSRIDWKFLGENVMTLGKLMGSDKKAKGKMISLPLPERIGKAKVCEVELEYIRDYLERHSES